MSNHDFDRGSWGLGKRRIELRGLFVPLGGAGTVAAATVKGFGFGYAPVNGVNTLQPTARPGISGTPGIVRTGVGVYTLTLDDSYLDLESINATCMCPAGGGGAAEAQFSATVTNLGVSGQAPVFTLNLMTSSGTPTDLGSTYKVCFQVNLIDSTVQLQKP